MAQISQVINGNYHSYYEFRSDDRRSSILRQHLETQWKNMQHETRTGDSIHMLDIGCNSGNFTAAVRNIIEEVSGGTKIKAIGVDIDPELCDRANDKFPGIKFVCGNILRIAMGLDADTTDPIEQYMTNLGIKHFDIVCCFSVLMYVHLNGGDDGIRRVLDYLGAKSKFLILELQAWRKYRDQVRRLKRTTGQEYPRYSNLEWKGGCGALENYIKTYVISKGFEMVKESVEKNEFDRQLIFFKNKNI